MSLRSEDAALRPGRASRTHLYKLVATGVLCGAAGLAAGTLFRGPGITHGNAAQVAELREQGTSFVHPLLECDQPRDAAENLRLATVQRRVEGLIRDDVRARQVGHVSVYFRDLNVGSWFSVNPAERYVPASLLKVPVMLALLSESEDDPQLLRRKILYDGTEDLTREQYIKPAEPLEPGATYSLGELARRMIAHSDNNAARLVLESLPAGALERLYDELGVRFDGTRGDESFISVEAYAMFFRVLYNGTYLDRRSAEAALAVLTQRSYQGGLRAGVPADVPLAAKFGEWRLREDDPDREQLHDCGIVYHPARPYLLCVMTRGPQSEPLDGIISGISRAVYEEVDASSRAPEALAGLFKPQPSSP